MHLQALIKKFSANLLLLLLTFSLTQPAFAKEPKPKKARKPGTAYMVLGIVFTPIMGATTLLAAASYSSAADYNCDWGRAREDGTAEGERWRSARERCYSDRKSHMRTTGTVTTVALLGLGISITGIVVGSKMRSAASDQPEVNLHYNTTGNKDWKLALNFPVN